MAKLRGTARLDIQHRLGPGQNRHESALRRGNNEPVPKARDWKDPIKCCRSQKRADDVEKYGIYRCGVLLDKHWFKLPMN